MSVALVRERKATHNKGPLKQHAMQIGITLLKKITYSIFKLNKCIIQIEFKPSENMIIKIIFN